MHKTPGARHRGTTSRGSAAHTAVLAGALTSTAGLVLLWMSVLVNGALGRTSWLRAARRIGSAVGGQVIDGWLDWRYGVVLLILGILGWLWPAERGAVRLRVRAIHEDFAWFLLGGVGRVVVVGGVLGLVGEGWQLLGGWSWDLTSVFGVWGVAVLAFVVGDLMAWTSHWLHHRVPALWHFHAVHHSQTRMNALSDNRTHVVESVVAGLVAFLPGVLLGLNSHQALVLAYGTMLFSAMIHANVATNLGALGLVVISPQAHRIHHSVRGSHFDSNYGTVLTVWDRLFGTLHPDRESFPLTGIADPAFPVAKSDGFGVYRAVLAQNLYPFRQLMGQIVDRGASTRRLDAAGTARAGSDVQAVPRAANGLDERGAAGLVDLLA